MYQPGDWRSGQEPALPRSIRSEYFPILKKTPEKLEFLSSILDLSFCLFFFLFLARQLAAHRTSTLTSGRNYARTRACPWMIISTGNK